MVLHYKDNELTRGCCDSIDRTEEGIQYSEKVIVDNGSDVPHPKREGWKVYRIEKNRGNIGGQKCCFEIAKSDRVLFVSNDVRFITAPSTKGWFGMPEIYRPDLSVDSVGLDFNWPGYASNKKSCFMPEMVPSICYWLKKNIYDSIGGHDKSFISSHEDIDLSMRLRKIGVYPVISEGFKVIHLGNKTLGRMPYYTRRLIHEARMKVVKKHYRGLDRALRLAAINTIDWLSGASRA